MPKLIHGAIRTPGTWGAQLEPGDGLTPLSAVVGAALATVLFACRRASDFAESAMDDREDLIARWGGTRQQQQGQPANTHAEVDAA
jgi:hypothetical protein